MLRNRISAQNSRDRKKKEFDELKLISQTVINENKYLKKQFDDKSREIAMLREKISKVCDNCNKMCNGMTPEVVDFSFSRNTQGITGKLKYSLMAGFLVVVCLLGSLTYNNVTDNLQTEQVRVLVEGVPEIPVSITEQNAGTDIMPYNKDIEIYKSNYPFRITKEKKQNSSFLNRKRYDFLVRMDDKNKKFLNENTCPNTDTLNYSISEDKGILPTTDSNIINYDYNILDKEFYHKNIKSMYCRDFITAEQNSRIFNTMFEKVNFQEK
jgi:predicted RNase H-like nuclease (RuvC/YqgF family)